MSFALICMRGHIFQKYSQIPWKFTHSLPKIQATRLSDDIKIKSMKWRKKKLLRKYVLEKIDNIFGFAFGVQSYQCVFYLFWHISITHTCIPHNFFILGDFQTNLQPFRRKNNNNIVHWNARTYTKITLVSHSQKKSKQFHSKFSIFFYFVSSNIAIYSSSLLWMVDFGCLVFDGFSFTK